MKLFQVFMAVKIQVEVLRFYPHPEDGGSKVHRNDGILRDVITQRITTFETTEQFLISA
jgi:hypothetical protein